MIDNEEYLAFTFIRLPVSSKTGNYMEEEIFNRKVNSWKEKLLDLSKRNRLLNYKCKKRGTYLFSQSMEEVYDTLVVHDGEIELGKAENGQDLEELKNLRLNLTTIRKSINSNYDELGFNTGYAALGMLSWQEADNASFQSPVVLVPVRVDQENRNDPFLVSLDSDEEIQINPVLAKKLSDDYGITISVEQEHPTLDDYFTAVRNVIKDYPQWHLDAHASLDIFSFQNLIILKDLEKNRELISSNPFIKALYSNDSRGLFDRYNENLDLKKIPAESVLTVLDADSSQYEAVARAQRGDSFVLQGPPGTGKSQTITNIICDQLGRGKRVLFVSEKQAALEVVYNKLKKLGLEDFVLALHSAKQSKTDIRGQLEKSLVLASHRQELSPGAMNTYRNLNTDIRNLDHYDDTVHEPRKQWGASFFDIQGKALTFSDSQFLEFEIPDGLKTIDKDQQDELFQDLKELSGFYSPDTGRFADNNWQYLKDINSIITQTSLDKIRNLANRFPEELSLHKSLEKTANDLFPIHLPPSNAKQFLTTLMSLYDRMPPELHAQWYALNLEELFARCTAITSLMEEISALEKEISEDETAIQEKFEPDFMHEEDVEATLKALKYEYNNFLKRLFSKKYRNLFKNKKQLTRNLQLTYEELLKNLETLSHRNTTAGRLESKKAELQNRLDSLAKELGYPSLAPEGFDSINNEILWLREFKNLNEPQPSLSVLETPEKNKILNHAISDSDWEVIRKAIHEYAAESANLDELIKELQLLFNFASADPDAIGAIISNLDFENRAEYISFRKKRELIKSKYGIGGFLDSVEKAAVPGENVVGIFGRKYYGFLLDSDEEYREVSAVSRKDLDDVLSKFKTDDISSMQLARDRIYAALQQQIPDPNMLGNDGEIGLLKKELKKKNRLMSTRKLIEQLPVILPLLKPCIMMSPITVSNYFMNSSEWKDFDLVIFDEASQVKTEYAVAAIARGKQIIVAGDSKQMPPTDFFTSGPANEDEDEETADLESILDDLSVKIPTQSLDWHYRSKDESLIAYSNAKFYANRLYTFPSTLITKEESIRFEYVPDGIWESKHGNQIEARRTAELIFDHIHKTPGKSLGVVAFGARQAEMIETEVLRLRDMNPQYESFFQENNPEPFFIKNLENVQGDERDVIFLCIGYAKDPKGKLSMNFGPLTMTGGERRLNVAVSRARESMTVVSSIKAIDIRTSDTQNENRFMFRDFLDYAERGPVALLGTTTNELQDSPDFDSPFEEDVYTFLVSKGYKLHTQVGASGYKIDMALLHPEMEGRYVLAIECDGATYHSSRTARDRDRLRQEILEDKGWNFYRIWSTVWFNDREAEEKRLLEAVEKAIINYDHRSEEPDNQEPGSVTTAEAPASNLSEAPAREPDKVFFPDYYRSKNPYDMDDYQLAKILTLAAGVQIGTSKTGLMQYVNKQVFDKKRLTAKMREAYEKGLNYAVHKHWILLTGDTIRGRTSEKITI